jgi:hypothetical protein
MADPELDEHAQALATTLQLLMGDLQDHEKRALIYAAFPDSFLILVKRDNPFQSTDEQKAQVASRLRGSGNLLSSLMTDLDGSTPYGRIAQEQMRAQLDTIRTDVRVIGTILGLRT